MQGQPSGTVVGPAAATDNAVAKFDGTTGKLLKDGVVLGSLATQNGTFSGTSSGTNTGDQTNISGNAATVTTNANLTGPITSTGNATAITSPMVVAAIDGGTAANDDIAIQGTSNGTRATSRVNIQSNGGTVGIGTVSGSQYSQLHVVSLAADGNTDNNGIIQCENASTSTGGATNAQFLCKSKYGSFQLMKWEAHGTRIGNRSTANGGAGAVYFTTDTDTPVAVLKGFNFGIVAYAGASTVLGSSLSVDGRASIGANYYSTGAPTNGLIVEGKVGFATTAPDKALEVNLGTADALRLTYNDANGSAATYMDTTLSSAGVTTFTGAGSAPTFNFMQAVITAATATGSAGLRLPHGTAPSAPVDGDIWTTTAGLFVRINGVTKSVNLT